MNSTLLRGGAIPFKIVLIYALVGGLWILFSDLILSAIIKDPVLLTRIEIFKGWFFIGITAVLLYALIKRDISAIGRSERALRESEEKFQLLIENTASAIFIYRGRILHVNHATETLTGYSKEELMKMNFHDVVHPDHRERIREHCEAFQKGKAEHLRCEYKIIRKSGEERWIDFTSSVIKYEGEPSGLGTAFDITERKLAEETLRESEERFRLLVESVTDYEIFMLDTQGRIVSWNIGAERSKGYRPEEIIGRHHSIFFTKEDIDKGAPEQELRGAEQKESFEDEGWRVRKDGTLFWANIVTTALHDYNGNLRGYSKVVRDITEKKRAEETLRESEERHRVIAETASDAIITIDEESTIILCNPAIEKIFGYSVEEIIGRKITVLMPERLRSGHLAGMKRYLDTGVRALRWGALEVSGLHKKGYEIPLEISYGVFVKEGKHFFTGIVRDITERKQAEKERGYKNMLERFTSELETLVAERTMSLMALTLADRVRNPASVIGWTGRKILGKGDIPERLREGMTTIIEEAEELEETVEDFQTILKIKKSVFGYEDINEIVRGIAPLFEEEARSKGVKLELNLSEQPLRINAEKDILRMALFNLLRNAIEATPEGGLINVASSGDGNKVILSVSDTGPGIPEEAIDMIFEPFFSTKKQRFGMGLPLIKQIVNEHMGKIEVKSKVGKGATFTLFFPVRWKEEPARSWRG